MSEKKYEDDYNSFLKKIDKNRVYKSLKLVCENDDHGYELGIPNTSDKKMKKHTTMLVNSKLNRNINEINQRLSIKLVKY